MTAENARQKLISWAQEQIGKKESSNNWNPYAENADLARLYGWKPQNEPWCDVFVDTGFIECFGLETAAQMTYQPIGKGSALCRQSAQYYRAEGAFTNRPEPGDQVFFYVSGEINHTGIVVRVYGGTIVTVEGNSSDMVAERTYSTNDSRIAGYGRPKWSAAANVVTDDSESANSDEQKPDVTDSGSIAQEFENDERYYGLKMPYLRRGSTGNSVIAVQFQLAGQGYNIGPDGADGDFGGNTEEAVKEFQLNVGISADGIVGPKTGARLFGGEVILENDKTAKIPEEKKTEKAVEQTPSGFWNSLLEKIRGGN